VSCRSPFTIAAAASFLLLAPFSAFADCKTAAVDDCLLGTWKQTGGGAADWMREHMKMAQIKIQASEASFTFNGDGTFSTSKINTKTEVTAKDAPIKATGSMSTQGSGLWSAADGKLTLCVTAVDAKGGMALKAPGGQSTNIPMPHMGPSEVTMTYTCDGDTLSTVQAMPMNSTMTTTYTRAP